MSNEFDELGYWIPPHPDCERCVWCGLEKQYHWPYTEGRYVFPDEGKHYAIPAYHEFVDFRSFVLIQLAGEWFTHPHAFPRYRLPDRSDPFEWFIELGIHANA